MAADGTDQPGNRVCLSLPLSLSPSSPLLLLHTTHTHTRTRTHTHTHANTQNSDRPHRGCSNPCKRRVSALRSALRSPGSGFSPDAALSPGALRARFGRVSPRIKRGGRVQTDQKTRQPHTPRLQLWLGTINLSSCSMKQKTSFLSSSIFFFNIYFYLAALGLSCIMGDLEW